MAPARSDDDRFRALPSVDRVAEALSTRAPAKLATGAARRAIDLARQRVRAGSDAPTFDEIVADARHQLETGSASPVRSLINGTGVLIHTNLGRSPLGDAQLAALVRAASGYSDLEYDTGTGARGDRTTRTAFLLSEVTGAEAGLVVNNNAAAVLVTVAALAGGREVIVSRGELVEIGGEFRIPEVVEAAGATVVEIGTTNRTHIGDYERAIGPRTGAILKVHRSNYEIVGFTAEVPARDLARLARARGVTFVHDLGSGLLQAPPDQEWAAREPLVSDAVDQGADVVTFSGDKLLGGPQAGLIVGRGAAVRLVARHPLVRAVRADKLTIAAIDETLRAYAENRWTELPLWKMALTTAANLETRARRLAEVLAGRVARATVEAVPSAGVAGGGSVPGTEIASWAIALADTERGAAELERALRWARIPIVARVEGKRVLVDLRTVDPAADELLVEILAEVFS